MKCRSAKLLSLAAVASTTLCLTLIVLGARSFTMWERWYAMVTKYDSDTNDDRVHSGHADYAISIGKGGICLDYDASYVVDPASGRRIGDVFQIRRSPKREWEFGNSGSDELVYPSDPGVFPCINHRFLGFAFGIQKEEKPFPWSDYIRVYDDGAVVFPVWFAVALTAILPCLYLRKTICNWRRGQQRGFEPVELPRKLQP